LKECKSPHTPYSCNGRLFYKALQFPFAASGGALCGTFNNFDTDTWSTVLQEGMDFLVSGCKADTVPTHNRIILAAKIQKFKSDNTKGAPKHEEKAIHVEFPKAQLSQGIRHLKRLVKQYQPLRLLTNLPLIYAPAYSRDLKSGELAQLKSIKNFNTRMASALNTSYLESIQDIDVASKTLGGYTLRRLLLELRSKTDKNQFLIMAIDLQWNNKYCIWYNDIVKAETEELLKFLHLYVARSLDADQDSGAIDKWFTVDALDEARDWTWDEALGRPISMTETEMQSDLAAGNQAVSLWMPIENLALLGCSHGFNSTPMIQIYLLL